MSAPMVGSFTSQRLRQLVMEYDFRLYLTADFIFGIAAGIVRSYWEEPFPGFELLYSFLEVLGLGTTFAALRAADLSWGWPEMAGGYCRGLRDLLACLWFAAMTSVYPIVFRWNGFYGFVVILLLAPTLLGGIRGWPLLFGAVCWVAVSYFSHDDFHFDNVPPYLKVAIGVGVPARLRYLYDQRLAACICIMPLFSYFLGYVFRPIVHNGELIYQFAFMFIVGLLMLYFNVLLRRNRRNLPPGLQGAKFVRLSFLRRMLSSGEMIRRCQELPEEAFGDAAKAIHFVILSHRWLDPRTSDVATPEYPRGVNLTNLVRRLDAEFFPSHTGSLWQRFLRWYRTACIGGWDVVIFFDFMSLPQNGIAADGSIILRSLEETKVFLECLPNMGTLYSLFPVLALTEMPEENTAHNYFGSGWCFCEFIIAMLNKQLSQYSNETLQSFRRKTLLFASMQLMDEQAAMRFQEGVMSELGRKTFRHESDRKVVGGIIEGFLTKRLLLDSIRKGDMARMQRLLMQLAREGLLATLHEPVDGSLNTLLHIAVQARDVTAVKALLSSGARPHLRNVSGDTPSQWFLFPRMSTAARTVREAGRNGCSSQSGAGATMLADNLESECFLRSN